MKGKDKCEFLKGIRKRMAEANGIPYEPRECTYEGDCTGTCPFCEKEAAELMAIIRKKEAEGAEIKKDDVGMLAIELGINECEGTGEDQSNEIVLTGAEGTLVIGDAEKKKEIEKLKRIEEKPLRGDVPTPEELRRIEERERLELKVFSNLLLWGMLMFEICDSGFVVMKKVLTGVIVLMAL